MRWAFLYLLVVTFSLAYAEVNVTAGYVKETNLFVAVPLKENATWVGIYGKVTFDTELRSWQYYSTAFGSFSIQPPPEVEYISLDTEKILALYYIPNHWFGALSESSDVNLYDLSGTCDQNVDALIEGNFCEECIPSKTFTSEENILLNGRTVCAKYAYLTDDDGTKVPLYLALYDGNVVYISPIGIYSVSGTETHFMFMVSAPGQTTFHVYLLRDRAQCGDYVCDPGEETNCPGDCVKITITSNATSADVNVGDSVNFILTVKNETNTYDVDVNLVISSTPSPGESTYTYELSPSVVHVLRLDSNTALLTITPHAAGIYYIRVSAYLGSQEVDHVTITIHAVAPEEEETPSGGGGGAAPPPSEEENLEAVPIAGGGYWLPALGCISNIQVVGPDRINALLEENVAVNISLQNAGTCDENVSVTVEGVPDDWVYLPQRSYTLAGGEGIMLPLHIFTKSPGVYTVRVTAMGYTGGYHEFQLLVAKERAPTAERCTHNIVVVAPEEISVSEGEDVNNIIVSNAGTCREQVTILVKKRVGDLEVILDKKEFYLSPGERYVYNMPKLASGDYMLFLSAGNVSKESKIHVLPPPVLGELSETFVRLRWALVLIMFIVLIGAIGYVRYRYLR